MPPENLVEATVTLETGGSERSNTLSHVFVLDANRTPLNPIHPGSARRLLTSKKAAVFRRFPLQLS